MASTEQRPRPRGQPLRAIDDSDDLRRAFNVRLQSEGMKLVTLSAALARSEDDAVQIFADLVSRASGLRRGAAILEAADVADAAIALEQAAGAASLSRAGNTDAAVWTALVRLVNLIETLDATSIDSTIAADSTIAKTA